MNINRLVSRHKSRLGRNEPKPTRAIVHPGDHLLGFFNEPEDLLGLARSESLHEKKQDQKVKEVKLRILKQFPGLFTDDDILYALRLPFSNGNIDKAVKLLTLVKEADEYHIKSLDGRIKEVGAVNRAGVSCYLDSVLFAMFAQLSSFDSMLDKKLDDPNRNHLAALLRLWVNAERTGELITTDITEEIQSALAKCGWKDAGEKRQQDALEAFSFILEQLGFPDLHLKMDIFHSGKEDKHDDHKIIRERVLAMPLPEARQEGPPIKLEDCFELALTARVDVKRRYEERRATISSVRSQRSIDFNKAGAVHVESVEAPSSELLSPAGEVLQSPSALPASQDGLPSYQSHGFIQERYVDLKDEKSIEAGTGDSNDVNRPLQRRRASTLRKEVLMPAWQMYSLIPFHTDEEPKSDEEVIEHLRKNRPTFCIALKRYSYTSDGQAVRRDDRVDIPLDMALPYFIYDHSSMDNNSLFENFKISLQSLVCHRGKHVDAGHYISLVRTPESESTGKWLLHDDLADQRVREIDISEALKNEMPYLLFYRVEPIEGDLSPIALSKPPSLHSDAKDSGIAGLAPSIISDNEGIADRRPSLARRSSGLTAGSDRARGRNSTSRERPVSIALTDSSERSAPTLDSPADRAAAVLRKGSLKLGSRRNKDGRAGSQEGEKRHSASLNRLSGLFSRQDADTNALKPLTINTVPAVAVASIPSPVPENLAKDPKKTATKLEKERDKERSKSRKASRVRLSSSKKGEGRPDRECIIM